MGRALSIQNIYNKKHSVLNLEGVMKDVIGIPEDHGAWLIWGQDKNGKTWFTLMLSDNLSQFKRTLYISAEEGMGKAFKDTMQRAKLSGLNNSLVFSEYIALEELYIMLNRRKAPRIVIIDNITVYNDELKNGALRKLLLDFPTVLFIFLAHEDRGEPYTATAKLCKRLAKIIVHVAGLACDVSGRCPGGRLIIDEERAALFHGEQQLKRIS
jgi:hypothetical protein